MFVDAKVCGNGYCGPTSISAVTGLKTSDIAAVLRKLNQNRIRVRGINDYELLMALNYFGVKYSRCKNYKKMCNLRNWISGYMGRDKTYILRLTGHYIVVRNGKVVCTQFRGKITDISKSKYLGSRVKRFWEIESEPSRSIVIPVSKRNNNITKRKVLRLAKLHDIEIEHYEHDRYDMSIWMFLPDDLIINQFSGVDPWEEQHYFYDYEEALEAIQKIFAA
jgi:hypothetical protein